MVDFSKPIKFDRHGAPVVYVGRCPNPRFPHVVSSIAKKSGEWYVVSVSDEGHRVDGGMRIINVPAPENVPEEW